VLPLPLLVPVRRRVLLLMVLLLFHRPIATSKSIVPSVATGC
jgi:hypothetical protein